MVSGLDWYDNNPKWIDELYQSITSQNVSAQVKFDVMQRAMATCPMVNMGYMRKRIPSLLDSGSQFILIHQNYFEKETLPHIVPSSGKKAEVHQLFQLTAANNGKLPMSIYVKLDLEFLGIMVLKFGVPITYEPNELLGEHWKTKLPGTINWNFDKISLSGVQPKIWSTKLWQSWLPNRC